MKRNCLWLVMAALLAVSCSKKENGAATGADVDLESAVDLTEILQTYEMNNCQTEIDYENQEVAQRLYPVSFEDNEDEFSIEIYDAEPFTLSLPEYRDSNHPFLQQAEDLYNTCLIAANIRCNYEVWERFYDVGDSSVAVSTRSINLDCIVDKDLRQAVAIHRDGIASIIESFEEKCGVGKSPLDLYVDCSQVIQDKWYKYYDEPDSLLSLIEAKDSILSEAVQERYDRYLQADEESRLGVMLRELNACQRFDEQCTLYKKWANCEESEPEDEWLIAVGKKLMESGRYCYSMHRVWLIWRPLCQSVYYGLSRDSEIPNRLYNEYRGLCYKSCLRYIALHPDDLLAINCASIIAGRANIYRYGEYPFGNQSTMEKIENMPARYASIFEDEEDEDVEE